MSTPDLPQFALDGGPDEGEPVEPAFKRTV
jgi:hypothetical protein